VTAVLDELVESLLYEGYALYPYTPGATKNATPTPFGILYPPVFAAGSGATFDHLRLECRLAEPGDLSTEVRFLQQDGEGHRGVERRVVLDGPGERAFAFGALSGRVRSRVDGPLVRVCVHNLTEVAGGLGRTEALLSSLISTHVLVRAAGGRFVSPLDAGLQSVNTFPVLATESDDVVLGAAIVLPDHPQLAAQSRGSLFDGTEIEEALLLHVQALSAGERSEIAAGDPAVRAMVERAAAATPQEIFSLHGVMRPAEEEVPGETETVVGGVAVRRGAKLVLRPGPGGDAHDFLLAGRTATLERIYIDYDDAVHLAVTVDSDPMQEVLRESGRFLFFKPHEVEVVQ
jgi:hypothetical protein